MCLIFIAYHTHPDFPLIVAANRDEFYGRPTLPVHCWDDHPGVWAGRDLKEGGTWMGVHQAGRFAAVTNYRSGEMASAPKSRGNLTKDLLLTESPRLYINEQLIKESHLYGGFNLLSYDGQNLFYCSNRGKHQNQVLAPGFYGLSNGHLNSDWPKIQTGLPLFKGAIGKKISRSQLWQLLASDQQAADAQLPDTGIGLELERLLSARFIQSPIYGTRASTLLFWHRNASVEIIEKSFDGARETNDKAVNLILQTK